MSIRTRPFLVVVAALAVFANVVSAVPVDTDAKVADRKGFIPNRKHQPLPGTVIGVIVPNAQPVLTLEGRSGPADQLCFSTGGCSYRWMYVPVERDAQIPRIDLMVGTKGERKRFENLSLATAATLKPFGIDSGYALVEVEVNGGLGSPADDSFVATKIRRLDGTEEFPLKLGEVLPDVQRRYVDQSKEQVRLVDGAMEKAADAALKGRKATGPRERTDVTYVTWMPDTKRLRVHVRTIVADGNYQYAGGMNIEYGRPRTMVAARPGAMMSTRLPDGLRNGVQFGVEFGTAYEVSASGKLERTLNLPLDSFQREVKAPSQMFGGRYLKSTEMKRTIAQPVRTAKR